MLAITNETLYLTMRRLGRFAPQIGAGTIAWTEQLIRCELGARLCSVRSITTKDINTGMFGKVVIPKKTYQICTGAGDFYICVLCENIIRTNRLAAVYLALTSTAPTLFISPFFLGGMYNYSATIVDKMNVTQIV